MRDGREVRIGSRSMDILILLLENPGQLISTQELILRAWPRTTASEANLRAQMFSLRQSLGDGEDGQRYIQNVPGRGYRFVRQVNPPDEDLQAKTPPPDLSPQLSARVIGREDIIAAVAARLPHRRLVTLAGPGGIGKTTVAISICDIFRGSAGAVHWVDFGTLTEEDSPAEAVALALGVTNFASDYTPALISWLKPKRLLLVFDCCDRVVEAVAALAERILAETSDIFILATSREVLRANGEQVVRLPPLEAPEAEVRTAEQALAFPAVRLFVDRAAAALGGFTLRDEDVADVVRICARLDGIALAIELAAGHLVAIGLRSLATLLDDKFRLLATGRRTALARHQTMHAVLDWSYETLSDVERITLLGLSLFESPAPLTGLRAVLADHGWSGADLTAATTTLVDKSLVSTKAASDGVRYALLDTTRAFAQERLAECGNAKRMASRHAYYVLRTLQRIEAETHGYQITDWFAVRRRELADMRAALNWAYANDEGATLRLPLSAVGTRILFDLSLVEQLRRRGHQALTWLGQSGTNAPAIELRLRALMSLGSFYSPGPTAETVRELEALATLAEELGDREYLPIALWGLWSTSMFHNAPQRALAYADRFKAISGGLSDEARDLLYLRMSGMALHIQGEHAEARRRLEKVSETFDSSVHAWSHLGYHVNHGLMARLYLGRIMWTQGEADRALSNIRQGVDILARQSQVIALCHALCEISIPLSQLSGDMASAKNDLVTLRTLADKHGLTIFQAAAQSIEMAFSALEGDNDPAGCRSAMEALHACRYDSQTPWLSGLFGEISLNKRNIEAGIAWVDFALAGEDPTCPPWWRPELLRIRALLAAAGSSPPDAGQAEAYIGEALSLARAQGALTHELRATLAKIAFLRDVWPASRLIDELTAVLQGFADPQDTEDFAAAHRLLSELAD